MDERPTMERHRGARVSWAGEAGARRLFACVRDAGSKGHDLPTRLEAGLRAGLGMLAAEPQLAYLLTVEPSAGGEDDTLDARRHWIARFGELLREAAGDDPLASQEPAFLAPFLIGGVRFQIARLVLKDETAELPRLLPGLLEGLLSYYFEPAESHRLASGASGLDH